MESEHEQRPPQRGPPGESGRSPASGRPVFFDVNETLSDMSPMAQRFEDIGAPSHLAKTWFAGLLRDGFALTAVDASASFARIAAEALRVSLHALPLNRGTEEAVQHIMDGFGGLQVHSRVPVRHKWPGRRSQA